MNPLVEVTLTLLAQLVIVFSCGALFIRFLFHGPRMVAVLPLLLGVFIASIFWANVYAIRKAWRREE
jgi:hypothetical protein